MRESALIFLAVFLAAGIASAQSNGGADIPRINAHSAYSRFMKGNILLVDSMSERTYAKYHIVGAINLPNDGAADLARIAAMDLQVPFDREVIVYCDCANEGTAIGAARVLKEKGYTNVKVVRGGFKAMVRSGFLVLWEGKIKLPKSGIR
jgi:rhodanese-related sulfurtransferase